MLYHLAFEGNSMSYTKVVERGRELYDRMLCDEWYPNPVEISTDQECAIDCIRLIMSDPSPSRNVRNRQDHPVNN